MATPRARGANQRNAQLGCARARSASRQSQPTRTRASARPVATTRRDDDEAGGSLRRQNRHVSSSSSSRHNDGDDDDGNARVRRRVSSSSTRSIIDAFVAGNSIRLSNQSRRRTPRAVARPSVRPSVRRSSDRQSARRLPSPTVVVVADSFIHRNAFIHCDRDGSTSVFYDEKIKINLHSSHTRARAAA